MAITYEQIEKVNEEITPLPMHGKNYAEVKERIKAFRKLYPDGYINNTMISNENGVCVFRSEVGYYADGKPILLGVGNAYEVKGNSGVNKTSYIENCETSACGRALGMLGIGIDADIASADELNNALTQQTPTPVGIPMPTAITGLEIANIRAEMERTGIYEKTILENMGMKSLDDLTPALYVGIMTRFRDTPNKKEK